MLAGMAAFHHRGPNGQRYWMAHDCRVALGHTRLSIINRCSIYGLVPVVGHALFVVSNDPSEQRRTHYG
jgi:asparagine synthetase B (glutamine-hydrolysing)